MRQHMLMATIGAAYSYLKAIADHSLRGSRRTAVLSDLFVSQPQQIRDAAQDSNAAYATNTYGEQLINPMRYILAKGSLPALPYVANTEQSD